MNEIMQTLREKFTSGNNVSVERTTVTAQEYAELLAYIKHIKQAETMSIEAIKQAESNVLLKVVNGEICYRSDADDQSFGMWCPYELDDGTLFYTAPPPAFQEIEELNELYMAAKNVIDWTERAYRPPVCDAFETGRMVKVRLHALADLQNAIEAVREKNNVR